MVDVKMKSVSELLLLIRTKQISCVDLVKYYLKKIEDNKDKNAVLEVFDDALIKAKEMDEKIASGEQLPTLAGLPIIIKDNILYKGKKCSCASKFLQNYVAQYNSTVVDKLLKAGVIILGRANMDEFAMGGSCEKSAFGPCKNALNDEYVSGGSSGGSAVVVAADMCAAAFGSDTGGSVRQPSSFNGVVGLKPTYGRVSRYGLVAFASSLDQIGPITRTVSGNALLLSVIAGGDANDDTSLKSEVPDYLKQIKGSVKGLKIALLKETEELISKTNYSGVYSKIASWFESEGAEIVELSVPDFKLSLPIYYTIAPAEATSNLARFDGIKYSARSTKAKDIDEVYKLSRTEGFGAEVKRRILLGNFVLSSGFYDAYYVKARRIQAALRNECQTALKDVDVLIFPTAFGEAFKLGSKTADPTSMYIEDMFTICANVTGLPAISVPCGKGINGLPLGLQIMGKAECEGDVYNVADYFEKHYKEGK